MRSRVGYLATAVLTILLVPSVAAEGLVTNARSDLSKLYLHSHVSGSTRPGFEGTQEMWLSVDEKDERWNDEPVEGSAFDVDGTDPVGVDTTTTWEFLLTPQIASDLVFDSGKAGVAHLNVQSGVPDDAATVAVAILYGVEIARGSVERMVIARETLTVDVPLTIAPEAARVAHNPDVRFQMTVQFMTNEQVRVANSPAAPMMLPQGSYLELPFEEGSVAEGVGPAVEAEPVEDEAPAKRSEVVESSTPGFGSVLALVAAAFVVGTVCRNRRR